MSATAAPQPMTITAGACAPDVPLQPTILSNVSFATVNSPPPGQTTVSNVSIFSTVTTTAALTFTQTAAVDAAQVLLIAQSVGPACSSIFTYVWPATMQQTMVELPTASATTAAIPSSTARTVTVLPATAPAGTTPSPTATPDDDGSYGGGRLGPYQSAGVGVSCTVVFLAVVYLLFLLWRRRPWQRRCRDDGGEAAGGKVAELSADCECSRPKFVAELPAIELAKDPVELPAFETWTSSGAMSELSSGDDDMSERGKSSSPLGDWLPTPT